MSHDRERQGDPQGDPTDPHSRTNGASSGVVSGEATPPDEHTRRVAALKQKNAEPTVLNVHDQTKMKTPVAEAEPASVAAVPPPEPRSRDLAERSLRDRRRERDRRAERTAIRLVIVMFVAVGVGGYFLLQSDMFNGPPETLPTEDDPTKTIAKALPSKLPEKHAHTSTFDETPDIPALRVMASEGLTIAAEGLPEVLASDSSPAASVLAAIETCRFAYGVWEFSPNKRFRFMPTCGALEGQTLVGAYELNGSLVRMSPLIDGPVQIVTEFEVEKPSRLKTEVTVTQGDRVLVLSVNQRVTTLRGGLEGDGFRATYEPKNTLQVPGSRPKIPTEPGNTKAPPKDPLLDLIRQPQQ